LTPQPPAPHPDTSRTSHLTGIALALLLPGAIALLAFVTDLEGKPGPIALYVIAVVLSTYAGGIVAGVLASLASFVGLSYFFTSETHGFEFPGTTVFALVSFLAASLLVASLLARDRRSVDRYRADASTLGLALGVSGMGAWEWLPESGRVMLSPEAGLLFGRAPSPAGESVEALLALVHRSDRPAARAAVDAVLAGGGSVALEMRVRVPRGGARWVEVRGNEMPRRRGGRRSRERRIVGVIADVTDRQARARAREHELAEIVAEHGLLASVLEQMPIGVTVAEAPDGTVLFDNRAGVASDGDGAAVPRPWRAGAVFRPNGGPVVESEWPLARSLATGEIVRNEMFEVRTPDGSARAFEVSSAPIRNGAGEVVAGVVAYADVSDRDRLGRERHFLSEVSSVLYASLDFRVTLARIASLVVPGLAEWCAIDLLEDGEIRNVVMHHEDQAMVERALRYRAEQRLDPDARAGVAAVIRTGSPELYPRVEDAIARAGLGEDAVARARELRLRSLMIVPLVARSATIGTMTLATTEGGRAYGEADLAIAEELARRVGLAVDNARLVEEQAAALTAADEARRSIGRLQAVTEAVSEAATRAEIANVLVREGLVALRAQGGAVFQLVSGGEELECLADAGYPDDVRESWLRIATPGSGPVGEALRTGQPVVTSSAADLAARWPELAAVQPGAPDETTITTPLVVGDDRIGVLHVAYRMTRTVSDEELRFAQTLARQCAQALERARLYEEERDAREQAERLAARLRRLQTVIDATFASGTVDELLARLLSRLRDAVGSDTAAILILDEKAQVLVTRESVGYDTPLISEVPVGQGFAGTVAATQQQRVVPDTSQIEIVGAQFRDSGVVSLAGVPLISDGRTIGVVHVGMRTPREFDREDLLLLRLVAARAAVAIDRAQVHEREHGIAEILQRSLLPERLPVLAGVEAAARYVPGAHGIAVGGDWYDVFELEDGAIGVAVGDVVGHGVRAAAAMGRLRNVLRAFATEGFGPADTLARLNRLACEAGADVFATVVMIVIEPSHARLRMATAGHPPPLLRRPDGRVELLEAARSLPLGGVPDAPYEETTVQLEPGSTLVLYTDGLVERRGESIDVGIDRLVRLVEREPAPVDELADRIVEELEYAAHTDDVALVAVRLEALRTPTLSLHFPARPEALAPLRARLRAWLVTHGADDDEVFDILVAVNEACSNAVEHPLGRADGAEVGVEATLTDGEISIEIRDQGHWKPPGPPNDRGRGFDFMRALMQDVDVARSPEGTHVRLRRHLRRSTA
jgi:serine phosphatase RsbU (regulator of sigma subunit)/anti-sigma regulatory factor (Ser/Thr protein kinase)/PAS domain-containing protein